MGDSSLESQVELTEDQRKKFTSNFY